MTLFILLGYVLIVVFLIHCRNIPDVGKKLFHFSCYVFIVLLFSLRGDDIPDTDVYKEMYYQGERFIYIEPCFLLLNKFFFNIGFSFHHFLLFLQICLVSLWYYNSRKIIENIPLLLFCFISFMGIFYFGVVLRAAISLIIVYIAIRYFLNRTNKYRYLCYYLLILIAVLFHYSMLIFIILPYFSRHWYNSSSLYILLLLLLFIPLINLQNILSESIKNFTSLDEFSRFNGYMRDDNLSSAVYPIRYLKNIIIGIGCVYARKFIFRARWRYNFILNIYILGCIFGMGLSFIGAAGSRFAMNFIFFEFLLLLLIYQDSTLKKKQISTILIFYSILNFCDLMRMYPSVFNY